MILIIFQPNYGGNVVTLETGYVKAIIRRILFKCNNTIALMTSCGACLENVVIERGFCSLEQTIIMVVRVYYLT